jgi:hypothetical protein
MGYLTANTTALERSQRLILWAGFISTHKKTPSAQNSDGVLIESGNQ